MSWLTNKLLSVGALIGCAVLAFLLFVQTAALTKETLRASRLETTLSSEKQGRAEDRESIAKAYATAMDALRSQQKIVNTQYQEALNEARKQTAVALRNERAARAESDGLREQDADAARRIADLATPPSAVREYAATVNGLFDQCQRDYQDMAAKAQGHSNDVATLIAAWPRVASMADSKPSQPE